jgi:hypothetical protein
MNCASDIKLGIVGGRDYKDYSHFKRVVSEYISTDLDGIFPKEIISGGASGVDTMAEKWSQENDIPISIFYPQWEVYGKKAGLLRNTDIINSSTHILALPTKKSRGTYDSISKAKISGKKVKIVPI